MEKIHRHIQWIDEIRTETLTHLDILYIQSGRLQVKTAVSVLERIMGRGQAPVCRMPYRHYHPGVGRETGLCLG